TDDATAAVPRELISVYEEASTKFGLAKNPLAQASMLVRLAKIYSGLSEKNPERLKAIGYLERARNLYRKENNSNKEGEIEESIADLYRPDTQQQVLALKRALSAYRKPPLIEPKRPEVNRKTSALLTTIGELLYESTDKDSVNQFFGELLSTSVDDLDKI